jgi:putative tryptophan/tyrosine transport system substrate-binding protein
MRRRTALALMAGALITAIHRPARSSSTPAQIGYLSTQKNERLYQAFLRGLVQHGHVEGTSFLMLERSAGGRPELLDQTAAELVRLTPDVILAVGAAATRAAQRATKTIPIIFAPVGDAPQLGFIQQLGRPEGNMTGISLDNWVLNQKRLEALKDYFPHAKRVVVLANFGNPSGPGQVEITKEGAKTLGLEVSVAITRNKDDLDQALAEIAAQKPDAVHVLTDAMFDTFRDQIIAFMAAQRLPSIYEHRAFTEAGGLVSYGPNLNKVSERAAWYVDQVLKGTRISDLPVDQPSTVELIVNLKTARATGIDIPPSLLTAADEVIE